MTDKKTADTIYFKIDAKDKQLVSDASHLAKTTLSEYCRTILVREAKRLIEAKS